ncbi:unnamed protein product [Lactuca virosa]|uniref:Uncharacterized protein n=1 Tax=Lactuca virosa TaxID=75947 RepID=A0AAU9MB91_9ASTR|nr:unnamed protein product [Lactuca virosa]
MKNTIPNQTVASILAWWKIKGAISDELCVIEADTAEGFDVGAILSISKRFCEIIEVFDFVSGSKMILGSDG